MSEAFVDALALLTSQGRDALAPENLSKLSSPDSSDLGAFRDGWSALAEGTRYQIASRLDDLAGGDPSLAFEDLFEVLLDDDMAGIRAIAISGLEEVMDDVLAQRMLSVAQNDPDADVRAEAATALGSYLAMVEGDGATGDLEHQIEVALLEIINTPTEDVQVRQRAVEAYAYATDPYVDNVLEEAYDSDEDEIRASAIFAMGRRGDEDWLPFVHRELRNEDESIRMAAIYAASEIGSGTSIPHLLQMIGEDANEDVRVAAVYALAEFETPEAGRILEELLDSGDVAISDAADDALEMRQAADEFDNMLMLDFGQSEDDLARGDGHLQEPDGSD